MNRLTHNLVQTIPVVIMASERPVECDMDFNLFDNLSPVEDLLLSLRTTNEEPTIWLILADENGELFPSKVGNYNGPEELVQIISDETIHERYDELVRGYTVVGTVCSGSYSGYRDLDTSHTDPLLAAMATAQQQKTDFIALQASDANGKLLTLSYEKGDETATRFEMEDMCGDLVDPKYPNHGVAVNAKVAQAQMAILNPWGTVLAKIKSDDDKELIQNLLGASLLFNSTLRYIAAMMIEFSGRNNDEVVRELGKKLKSIRDGVFGGAEQFDRILDVMSEWQSENLD